MKAIKYCAAALLMQGAQGEQSFRPVVQSIGEGHMSYFDLQDALHEHDADHMSQGDLDSYYLFKGFIEEAIKLDKNAAELEKDPAMSLDNFKTHFKGTHNLITAPVHRVMQIQAHSGVSKRSEFMKEFRIVGALAHVMMDVPERLIHVQELDEKLMRFVLKKAWPLAHMDIMEENEDIDKDYEEMSDAYHAQDWEDMGKDLADISNILHEELVKKYGEKKVA